MGGGGGGGGRKARGASRRRRGGAWGGRVGEGGGNGPEFERVLEGFAGKGGSTPAREGEGERARRDADDGV